MLSILNSPYRSEYNERQQGVERNGKNYSHNTKAVTAQKAIITNLDRFHQNIPPRKTACENLS